MYRKRERHIHTYTHTYTHTHIHTHIHTYVTYEFPLHRYRRQFLPEQKQ